MSADLLTVQEFVNVACASRDHYASANDVQSMRDEATGTCEVLQTVAAQRFVIEVERFDFDDLSCYVLSEVTLAECTHDARQAFFVFDSVRTQQADFYVYRTLNECCEHVARRAHNK